MYEVIDVRGKIHEANVQRIAGRVLNTVGASPHEDDIARAIQYPEKQLDNMGLIKFIINRCFPSPTLNKVNHPGVIEDIVIEVLVREHLSKQCSSCRMTKH